MASAIALQSTTGQTATISFNGTANKTVDANTLDQLIGVGQTWQDVTASRALGVTYTNTTGKPILVTVGAGSTGSNSALQLLIDNIYVTWAFSATGYTCTSTALVPSGSSYKLSTGTNYNSWFELR